MPASSAGAGESGATERFEPSAYGANRFGNRRMGEMDRLIGAGILGLLWFGVVAVNVIYLYGHVRDWTLDGPSTLPIVGSVLGVAALLLAPVGDWYMRLFALPVALLPDLAPVVVYRLIDESSRPRAILRRQTKTQPDDD